MRRVSLLTMQWADLPFEEVCKLASGWGFDSLEIACAGDHLDPWRGATDDAYIADRLAILKKYGLTISGIANHLTSQAVCEDPIDERHHRVLSDRIWGDGDLEGIRQRAAEEVRNTARTAQRLGVDTVIGFTGSSIWKYLAMFPPVDEDLIDAGWADFAKRWNPILDVFGQCGVRFAAEVHPSELAYDYWTAKKMLQVIDRPELGINWDPSHMNWMDIDPAGFLYDFADKIYNVHAKDSRKQLNGRNGRLGSHLAWADPHRGWCFVSVGHGDVPWESCFRALNGIGYDRNITVEWEDAGMDRMQGAPESLAFVRDHLWEPPAQAFDKAFATQR